MTKQNEPWQDIADAAGILRAHKQMELADHLQKHAEALAQPEQEPVGYQQLFNAISAAVKTPYEGAVGISVSAFEKALGSRIYTTPPQRKALTDQVIKRHIFEHTKLNPNLHDDQELIGYIVNAARAIEAAHGIKEKNT